MEVTGLRPNQDVITADLEGSRINKHTLKVQNFISHIKQNLNPFSNHLNKQMLYNISTGQTVSNDIEHFLLNIEELVNEQREQFINACSEDSERFEKVIKINKILNFAHSVPK
jgi:hypothetical protein